MSANISTLRANAATLLDTITAVRKVYDYIPDTAPPTPCGIIGNVSVRWDDSMQRGLDAYDFEVYVVVSRMSERSGQDELDALLAGTGAGSVKTALEAGSPVRSLNGAVSTVRVTNATPISITMGGVEFFAYRYEVEAYG
jgi:hypothetical protein